MPHAIYRELVVAATDERVVERGRPHFYALVWNREDAAAGTGTLRIDLSSYSGALTFRCWSPAMESDGGPDEVPYVELRGDDLEAALRDLRAALLQEAT